MAYDKTQPLIGNTGVEARTAIESNFDAISDFVEVDHVEFNGADQGKHNSMRMPEQALGPTTQANEGALYCKVSASSGVTSLFYRGESDDTEIEVSGATKAAAGWMMHPSGIITMWGSATVAAGSPDTSTFVAGAGIPTFTTMYNAQVSISGGAADDGAIYVKLLTAVDITVHSSGTTGPRTYYYFVIGV